MLRRILLLSLCLMLTACHKHEVEHSQTWTVSKQQTTENTLFFEGIIKPIHIVSVTSPTEGAIDQKFFHYGQQINKGTPLFHITSSKLQEDYRNALANYLKAKQSFDEIQNWENSIDVNHAKQALIRARNTLNFSEEKYQESTNLMQLGYISRDEFNSDKRQYEDAKLSYQEAQQGLEEVIKKGQGINRDVAEMNLQQASTILEDLKQRLNSITINAPVAGIALFPVKDMSNNPEHSTNIDIGSQVKLGDALVALGDMSGIAIDINVNEVDITRVALGQKVNITGIGFPDIQLQGSVDSIDAQANSNNNDIPSFRVSIKVPNLTDIQRQKIHVGMSAKVELLITHNHQLAIPIDAVYQKQGKSIIKRLNKATGKIEEIPITTGMTTVDSVIVAGDLKPGDTLVLNH